MSDDKNYGMERAQRLAADFNASLSINSTPSMFKYPAPAMDGKLVAYRRGQDDCKYGVDMWNNPYADRMNGGPESFTAWLAGWCYQKQLDSKK